MFLTFPNIDEFQHEEAERMNQKAMTQFRDFSIDFDLLNYINDTVQSAIEDYVQEVVDKELWLMLKGQHFEKRLKDMIDGQLRSLMQEINVKASNAGPGRGHKGRSYKKISLSLPNELYQEAKELKGFFSCHVAAALELYLKLQEKR
jgi:hypothetical protein